MLMGFVLFFPLGCASTAPATTTAAAPPKLAPPPPVVSTAPPPLTAEPVDDDEYVELATPTLRVIKLAPKAEPAALHAEQGLDAVDDGTPRPMLRLQGTPSAPSDSGIARAMPTSSVRSTPVISVAEWAGSSETEAEPAPSAIDPQARAAYKAAYRVYQERRPREALDAFAAFVVRWPDHPYVEQATYWRGECYVALGEVERAREQFQGVVRRFPGSGKAREAQARLASLSSRADDARKVNP